jgi:hypothetical protein
MVDDGKEVKNNVVMSEVQMINHNQSGVLQDKICPFLAQGICIYVGHSFFYETQLDQLP